MEHKSTTRIGARGDQTVAAVVHEFAEHGDPEVRDPVELPAALCAHALQEVRSDEFPQGPADVRKAAVSAAAFRSRKGHVTPRA